MPTDEISNTVCMLPPFACFLDQIKEGKGREVKKKGKREN
jgi:hypothetical protein